MGLFNIFKNKNNVIELVSPLEGRILNLSDVPDEAFSSGAIGDGIGIEPTGDTIYAPCDAHEISIFETNHAVSFGLDNDMELIVHLGVDTVELDGKGFTRIAKDGQAVKKGDPLVKFDLDFINKNAKSSITPVVIATMDNVKSLEKASGNVKPGDSLIKITLK